MQNNDFILFHKPHITDAEVAEITDTIKSGWWTTGPKTFLFEKKFNDFIGSKFSVTANSWTAAAHLVLEAAGIMPGDEVIVPAITFPATAEIVCYFKAKPVVVDVQPGTYNIDPKEIEKAITQKTKAVIPVHFAGQPCDMDEIKEICKKHNLFLLEDAAHALPSYYKGQMIGNIGDATCFSFYATKTLATGEGGMICTNNEEIAQRCQIMRLHGINRDAWKRYTSEGDWHYQVVAPGYKYNFTDIQASLGLCQLKKVENLLAQRERIFNFYEDGFKNNDLIERLELKNDRKTSYHLYPILLKLEKLKINRTEFINELKSNGIGTGVHFIPLYRHQYYKETYSYKETDYPVSEYFYPRELSLPIWPGMSDIQINRVIDTVNTLTKKYSK